MPVDNKYGKIISYRPNIHYKKSKSTSVSNTENSNKLNVILDFSSNSPSINIIKANNILARAREILKNIEDMHYKTKYADYTFSQYAHMVDDGKKETVNSVYDKASNDASSDLAIEMYKQIVDECDNVIMLDDLQKIVNYNDKSITADQAIKKDEELVNRVLKYDEEAIEKVNYPALYYCTKLNKLIEMKLEISALYINNLFANASITNGEKIMEEKNTMKKGINILFNDINEQYKESKEKFDKLNSYENFTKYYKHIAVKINEYCEALHLTYAVDKNLELTLAFDVNELIRKKASEIDACLLELYKDISNLTFLYDTMTDLLDKKREIKILYNN